QSGLLTGFSVLMLVAAGAMFLRAGRERAPVTAGAGPSVAGPTGHVVPSTAAGGMRRSVPVLVLTATGVGLLTGFFGVGGGFVVVPALVLVMGFDMATAVATSLLVIAVNSGAALAARVGTPAHVDWAVVGVFAAAAIAASALGSKVTGVVRPRQSARAFSVLLVAVAIYTLVRSLTHL
ncbi:MAG: sulfite exporter TauE/SafE family protein, partial [Acidobacteriota bacterium]|nr:sulfite exporter TauE/SafE family protein [Acidobacteriota bacterium]